MTNETKQQIISIMKGVVPTTTNVASLSRSYIVIEIKMIEKQEKYFGVNFNE